MFSSIIVSPDRNYCVLTKRVMNHIGVEGHHSVYQLCISRLYVFAPGGHDYGLSIEISKRVTFLKYVENTNQAIKLYINYVI